MGVMLSAAGSLAWLRQALGGVPYDELLAEAERWEPGAEGLLFQPYLAGERTPHADPDARGAFVGLSLRHDRGALTRAVLEGVAYGLRDSLELLRAVGVEATSARVSGGGARSELWLRIVASVLGLPLERTAVEEGAAYGAALLGAVAAGEFADAHEAVASCVRVRDRIEPEPEWREAYEAGYAAYTEPLPRAPPRGLTRSGASGRSVTVSQVSERELERKAETAALLLEVARQLGESLDPDRIYRRFHELLANVVQHDGIIVSSYDEAERLIRCEYAWVGGNEIDPATLPPVAFNPSGGMQSRVIAEGTPLLENDVAERVKDPRGTYYTVDPEGSVRRTPDAGPPGVKAAIMVPVKDEGRVVGVVQVMSDDTTYVPEHVEILEALAVQMAAAVRNARLQVERRRLEAAEAAARAVAAEREQAATVLEAVGDGIFLCDDDGVVQLWNRAAEAVDGHPRGTTSSGAASTR